MVKYSSWLDDSLATKKTALQPSVPNHQLPTTNHQNPLKSSWFQHHEPWMTSPHHGSTVVEPPVTPAPPVTGDSPSRSTAPYNADGTRSTALRGPERTASSALRLATPASVTSGDYRKW